jgi:hypothetical protein
MRGACSQVNGDVVAGAAAKNRLVERCLGVSCVGDGRSANRARLGSLAALFSLLLLRNPQTRQERSAVSTQCPRLDQNTATAGSKRVAGTALSDNKCHEVVLVNSGSPVSISRC